MLAMKQQQAGIALILILTLMIVGALSWFLASLNRNHYKIQYQNQTSLALSEAKEALLGFVASQYEESGGVYVGLPCPDLGGLVANEGLSEDDKGNNCGGTSLNPQNSLGRFPWRSLGLPPLRDGWNECLWYAVAGPYKIDPRGLLVNEDTQGSFIIRQTENMSGSTRRVLGTISNDSLNPNDPQRPVAVIFAPGQRLGTQNRNQASDVEICSGNYTASNYLESDNAVIGSETFVFDSANTDRDAVEDVITSSPYHDTINDVAIVITVSELFDFIRKRSDFTTNMQCLTQVITECIAQYGRNNGRLVWPAPVDLGDYRQNSEYDDDRTVVNLGRVPNVLNDSNADTGAALPARLLVGANSCDIASLPTLSECTSATLQPSDADFILKVQLLWQHWKDRFFYVVSVPFKPDAVLVPPATVPTCAGNCITVDATDDATNNPLPFAAMVLFSAQRTANQYRNMYPDAKTRDDITNYVIGNNSDDLTLPPLPLPQVPPDTDGVGIYTDIDDNPEFIMCIEDDFPAATVGLCL
jgi:hypothetical protein